MNFPGVIDTDGARAFMRLFEKVFPVFYITREAEGEIYFDYDFIFGKKDDRLVVAPNYYGEENYLKGVPAEAIESIDNYCIYPREAAGPGEPGITIKLPKKSYSAGSKRLNLEEGLREAIKSGIWVNGNRKPFRPIIALDAIRPYNDGLAHLKLHNLDLEAMMRSGNFANPISYFTSEWFKDRHRNLFRKIYIAKKIKNHI